MLPPLPAAEIDEVVAELGHLWGDLRGHRIFFTGATGFFGTWLLETLLAANSRHGLGIEIVALSRDPETFRQRQPRLAAPAALRWVRGSVADFDVDSVAAGLGTKRPGFDFVVHLATESDNAATLRDPNRAIGIIAGGTRRALEFAKAAGARRMLFTSSGSVFARSARVGERYDEEHPAACIPLDPGTAYGISGEAKRAAEAMCMRAAQDGSLAVSIARCFTFAGPGMPLDGKFAFGNFVGDALAGRPITIQGDGTPVRSYLYATDLARWLWTILVRGASGRVYNVGSESAVSVRELAEAVAREIRGESRVVVLGRAPASSRSDFYVPSTSRARSELGLAARVELPEAIRRTAGWLTGAAKH